MSLSSSLWPGEHGGGEGEESPTLSGWATENEERVSRGGDEDESSTFSGWTTENEERVSTLSGWTTETEGRVSQGGDEDEFSPFSGWGEAVAEARHPPDAGLADLHPFAVDALGGRVRGIVF